MENKSPKIQFERFILGSGFVDTYSLMCPNDNERLILSRYVEDRFHCENCDYEIDFPPGEIYKMIKGETK